MIVTVIDEVTVYVAAETES